MCPALTIIPPNAGVRLSKGTAGEAVANRAHHAKVSAVIGPKGAYIVTTTVYSQGEKIADPAPLIATVEKIQSEFDVGCKDQGMSKQ